VPYEAQQKRESAPGGERVKNRTIGYRLLRYVFSTIPVLLYSKNLASVIIRTALGMS
jgi:hypothetical protein